MVKELSEKQERMISDLQELADRIGKTPSQKDMREKSSYPSEYPFRREFGTWNDAKKVAGLEVKEYKYEVERPESSSRFAWFLGVLSGDGSVVKMNNGGVVSVHLVDNVYTSENPREKIKKFANNGLIESINLGNKFRVVEDKIPEKVLEEVN